MSDCDNRIDRIEYLRKVVAGYGGFPDRFPHDWRSARHQCQMEVAKEELADLEAKMAGGE